MKTMKKSVLVLIVMTLAVMTMICRPSQAAVRTMQLGPDVFGTLEYGTLTVSGTGEMYNYGAYGQNTELKKYASEISSIVINNGVTSVGDYMFCSTWSEVKNMSYSGGGASLFMNLQHVTIAGSVKTIGRHAFAQNSKLMDVTMAAGVNSIGVAAFARCSNLLRINFAGGLQVIDDFAFYQCEKLGSEYVISFPGTLLEIGKSAFRDCSISTLTIPESVRFIGDTAFYKYSSKMNITIPHRGTIHIGTSAFRGTVYGFAGSMVEAWVKSENSYSLTFIPKKIPVVLNGNGGTVCGSSRAAFEQNYGKALTLLPDGSAMRRAGYTFAGWYTDAAKGSRVTSSSLLNKYETLYLYAHWNRVTVARCAKPGLKNLSGKKLRISLKKLNGAAGYNVRVTGKKVKAKIYTVKASSLKKVLKNLKKKKTYYVEVRAFKKDSAGKKVYGPWSAKAKVKIKK